MAYISTITLPDGTTYDIKDLEARQAVAASAVYIAIVGTTTYTEIKAALDEGKAVIAKRLPAEYGYLVTWNNTTARFIFDGRPGTNVTSIQSVTGSKWTSSPYYPIRTVDGYAATFLDDNVNTRSVKYVSQDLTGDVIEDAETGEITITGQKGQVFENLGLGSLATMNYTKIV